MGLHMGEYSYGGIALIGGGDVFVGKFCSIANGVSAQFAPNHRGDWVTTYPFPAIELQTYTNKSWDTEGITGHPSYKTEVHIENDVWIGENTIFLGGASVGNGAIIGKLSVVAGHIPPYTLAVGNPAKVTKLRFPGDIIQRLLAIAWWDWPEEKINQYVHLLCNNDVLAFLAVAERERP